MKKRYSLILFLFILTGCNLPKIVNNDDGKVYKIINWEGGDFVYADYTFKGGKFDDALIVCKEFGNLVKERNFNETAISMFPDLTHWKLGMITKNKFDLTEIKGFKIQKSKVESGTYGVMTLQGYPESMFNYYDKFKKLLIKDGYDILSPVYEVYTYDTFNNESIPIEKRIGEIRYRIIKK